MRVGFPLLQRCRLLPGHRRSVGQYASALGNIHMAQHSKNSQRCTLRRTNWSCASRRGKADRVARSLSGDAGARLAHSRAQFTCLGASSSKVLRRDMFVARRSVNVQVLASGCQAFRRMHGEKRQPTAASPAARNGRGRCVQVQVA